MDASHVQYPTGHQIAIPYHQHPVGTPPFYSSGSLQGGSPGIPPSSPLQYPPGSPPGIRPGSALNSSSASSRGRGHAITNALSRVHVPNMGGLMGQHKKKPSTKTAIKKANANPDSIHQLPYETLLSLPPEYFNGLPPKKLQHLPEDVLKKVAPERLELVPDLDKLTPRTLARLRPYCLIRLQDETLATLTTVEPGKVAEILHQYPDIEGRLHNRALRQFERIPPKHFVNLPINVLSRLYKLSPDFFRDSIPPDAWRYLSLAQVESLPEEIKDIARNAQRSGSMQEGQAAPAHPSEHSHPAQPAQSALPIETDFMGYFERSGTWGQSAPSMDFPTSSLPRKTLPYQPQSGTDLVEDSRLQELKQEREEIRREKANLDREVGALVSEKKFLISEKERLEGEKRTARGEIFSYLRDIKASVDESGNAERQLINYTNWYVGLSEKNYKTTQWWIGEGERMSAQISGLEGKVLELTSQLQSATKNGQILEEKLGDQERLRADLERSRRQYADLEKRHKHAESAFQQRLDSATMELRRQLEAMKGRHSQEMLEAKSKLMQEKEVLAELVRTLQEENARNLQKWEESHQNEMLALHARFQMQVNEYQQDFAGQMERKEEEHKLSIKGLQERVRSLESSLVNNSDDFRPATDDYLKNSYEQLALDIGTVTHNLRIVDISRNSHLDPNGFLETYGMKEAKFLLQSIIWEQIKHGFFGSPFGLGALGPGEGKRKLLELWITYRRLLGGATIATVSMPIRECDVASVEQDSISVFRADKEANKWRSSTFQAIMAALMSKSLDESVHQGERLIIPYFNNRDQIRDGILKVLNQAAPGSISEDIGVKVDNLVDTAGELALQFGVQRAELGLKSAVRGDQIPVGREFIDCYDEEGEFKEVVLAISPMCYKAGDGRNDLHMPKVMAQGIIYSGKSQ